MKKPLAIIFNDAHLKTGNEHDVIESISHMLEYATSNNIDKIIFAGDLFDSRSFQRQSVLSAFDEILDKIYQAKCTLYLFPGNHDKTIYASYDSFLDVYRYHPCVRFNREIKDIEINGKQITLLPFFSDDMLIPMIENHPGGDVLISHFEMAGSTHLGQVSEKSSINKKLLSKWNKVYLGHYHNHHEITKDIVHLPSLRQNDFGEDSNKGFSILYDDLSYEIIKGRFRQFNKIVLNINDIDGSEIKQYIQQYQNCEDSIRFEFVGDEAKLKALDKSQFKGTGIDVKVKYEKKYNFDDVDLVLPTVVERYDKSTVRQIFKTFCNDKELDYNIGITFLDKFLDANGQE